jgi:hypothetical protein
MKKKESIIDYVYTNDSQGIFTAAECFNKAADLIENEIKGNSNQEIILGLTNASITNHSFSIELFLKCLQVIEQGRFKTCHNLLVLFNELNQVLRDRIISGFNDSHTYFPDSVVVTIRDKKYDFLEIITEAKNSFTESRYYFESKGLLYNYALKNATDCIKGIILECDPKIMYQNFYW